MSTYREALDAWLGELSVNTGTVFDVGGSRCAIAISSGGLLSGPQTNCV